MSVYFGWGLLAFAGLSLIMFLRSYIIALYVSADVIPKGHGGLFQLRWFLATIIAAIGRGLTQGDIVPGLLILAAGLILMVPVRMLIEWHVSRWKHARKKIM